jgi:hypothetical protein
MYLSLMYPCGPCYDPRYLDTQSIIGDVLVDNRAFNIEQPQRTWSAYRRNPRQSSSSLPFFILLLGESHMPIPVLCA